jgi:hypothetical protein
MSSETLEDGFVESLGDQTEFLVNDDRLPVGDRDAGRLLTSVLQRVERVISQSSDVFTGSKDTDDATGVPSLAGHQFTPEMWAAREPS